MIGDATPWRNLFPESEVPFILAMLVRCCTSLRKKDVNELENRLNKRLCFYLKRDEVLRQRPFDVDRESYIDNLEDEDAAPLGRSDIRFIYSTQERKPWPQFIVEAKRLNVPFPSGLKSLVGEYVDGKQGMMCFISGRYTKNEQTSAAMLGYVFSGATQDAHDAVATKIKHTKKLKLDTHGSMRVSSLSSDVFETIHALPHGRFVIYHIFAGV